MFVTHSVLFLWHCMQQVLWLVSWHSFEYSSHLLHSTNLVNIKKALILSSIFSFLIIKYWFSWRLHYVCHVPIRCEVNVFFHPGRICDPCQSICFCYPHRYFLHLPLQRVTENWWCPWVEGCSRSLWLCGFLRQLSFNQKKNTILIHILWRWRWVSCFFLCFYS